MTQAWWMKWRNRNAKTEQRQQLRSFRRRWFPRFNLERLEDRIVPTLSPLTYTIPSGGPNTVTVQLSGTDIQIVNGSNTSDVLAHQALASTSEVDVSGSSPSSDALTINVNSFVSGSPALTLGVTKSAAATNELAVSGVTFAPVAFTNISSVTVDASTTSGTDTTTVSSDGLVAAGLQEFTVETGTGGAFTIDTGGGSNTIDFSNFTGGPLTLSHDKLTFTAADGNKLILGTPAQQVDVNFASGAKTAVDGVLDKLSTLAGDLQTGASALSQLSSQLPLLDPTTQGSLAQVLGFSQKISTFVTDAESEISSLTTTTDLSTIVSDLNKLSSSLPSGFGSITFTSGYRAAPSDSTSTSGQLEGLIDVQLNASANASIPINLGSDAQDVGLSINGSLSLAATLTGNLTLGLTTDTVPAGFLAPSQTQTPATDLTLGATTGTGVTATAAAPIFSPDQVGDEIIYSGGSAVIRTFTDAQHVSVDILSPFSTTTLPSGSWTLTDGLTLGVNASLSSPNAALNLGFLSAHINGGSVDYSGTVHLGLADPDPDSGAELTTTELSSALASSPSSLVTAPQTTSSFNANLPVSVTAGVQVGGSDLLNANLSLALPSGKGLFDGAAPTFSLLGGPGNSVNLLDFSNVTPTEVMGMLGGVYNTFLSIAGNGVLNTPIPFTGKTVGDLLDYATTVKTQVLDPLFQSGNSLVSDVNGDGVPDFTFSNIQDLVSRLTTALGLGTPLVASYDPSTKELTFALSFDRALGFGQANVAEQQAGDASHDETQTLTINAINSGGTLTDTYRLAFPDPTKNGILQFTSAIPYGASAATLQSDLEALNGIGSGNVQVTGTGPYTITFMGALADQSEPLLVSDATQLAGAFPLNFGASLGSLASLQTSGNFGVTAGLSAGLPFGVDLHPSAQLQITPPVTNAHRG